MSNDDQQPAVNPPSGSNPGPASPFSRPETGGVTPQAPAQQLPPAAPSAGGAQPSSQPYPAAPQPYPAPTQPGATPPPYPGPAQPYPNQPYPNQPYPGQGYPGQPYGAQPNPGQAYLPPPGAMPGQPPTGIPPKRSNKTILLIGAAVVAVIIVIAVIVAMLPKAGVTDPSGGGGIPAPAKTGTEAVQGYLDALAAGNAAAALSYAEQAPADTSLLTDEILAASNAVTPITEIQVVEPANEYSPVTASYLLGDQTVSTEFYASNTSGSWKLESITRDIGIADMNGIALTINGVPVQDTRVTLFPGSYSLVPTNSLYVVDGGAFVLTSPQDTTSYTMQLDISSTGQQKLRTAAQAHLKSCLKKTSLSPKGCGFSIRANGTGAVKAKWSISSGKNAMKNAKFRLDLADPSRASAYTTVGLTVKGYNKSGSYVGRGVGSIFRANGDLSANPITVTFE